MESMTKDRTHSPTQELILQMGTRNRRQEARCSGEEHHTAQESRAKRDKWYSAEDILL